MTKPAAPTAAQIKGIPAEQGPPSSVPAPTSKDKMTLLFVYGTLKTGHALHDWLDEECSLIGEGVIPDSALIPYYTYPAMIVNQPGRSTKGELWLVTDKVFSALKDMEEKVGYKTTVVSGQITQSNGAVLPGTISAHAFILPVEEGVHEWEVMAGVKKYAGIITVTQN